MSQNNSPVVVGWSLPHIAQARPFGEGDEALVGELAAVLARHKALDRFGISLLHQHFPIGDDEIICEDVDPQTRILTARPIKRSEADQEAHTPTLWDLRTGEPVALCLCKDYGNGHSHWRC